MNELYRPLPSQQVSMPNRGDGSQNAIRAGVGSALTCVTIATLLFTVLGMVFTPAVLAAWPGALALGVGLGWVAGKDAPQWAVVVLGGALPFGNTLISGLLVAIISGEPRTQEFGQEAIGLDPLGVALAGMIMFSPLLFPLGLVAGWFIHRAVVRAIAPQVL